MGDYREIDSLAAAIAEVGEDSPLLEEWGWSVGDGGAARGLTAFAELRVICAALNGGWRPSPDDGGFTPRFGLLRLPEGGAWGASMPEGAYRLSDGSLLVPGEPRAEGREDWLSGPCELRLRTEGAARHCGREFIGWWAAYLLGRDLAGWGWRDEPAARRGRGRPRKGDAR